MSNPSNTTDHHEEHAMDVRRDSATQSIHLASAISGAIGFLSPIPGADAVLISPVQAALVLRLSHIYGQRPSSALLKAVGYAAGGQLMGKGSARLLAAFLPGIGSVVRAGVAAGITEGIGWAVVENLEGEDADATTGVDAAADGADTDPESSGQEPSSD